MTVLKRWNIIHFATRKASFPADITDYYRCIEDHLETFMRVYEERFERTYGFFRPYLQTIIYRYLDCGDLHNGFARVKCKDCNHEYLLAFSCSAAFSVPPAIKSE